MVGLNARLERLKPALSCPNCCGGLDFKNTSATCRECSAVYPIRNGRIYFVNVPEHTDELDKIKGRLKKWLGKYYYDIGIKIFAPTYPFDYIGWIRRYLNPATQIVVDVGCGNQRIDEHIICLDFFDYDAVDIVCDLSALPFKPNSVDAYVSRSVLEHVPNPSGIVAHFHRCTKVGGLGLHLIPFLFPFHASPSDFQRYTHKGLEMLFREWEIVEQTNATGPITLGLLNTIEFLSIMFSLGQAQVKAFIYLLLCSLLFPLKYLDALFVNRKSFLSMAPSIFTVVRKHGQDSTS
jgi:SAM-dependent methyltransferase